MRIDDCVPKGNTNEHIDCNPEDTGKDARDDRGNPSFGSGHTTHLHGHPALAMIAITSNWRSNTNCTIHSDPQE